MDTLQTIVAIILALGILVSIHEWGHFIVARFFDVKVLKFSVGFGQALYSRIDKKGTEFIIAWIPLGGYVKMVDEREGEVAKEDLPFAFNRKPPSQRIAIVAAGPAVNLLFAVLVYWFVYSGGQQVLSPVIGSIAADSIAEQAGLQVDHEVISVDGKNIFSWDEAVQALVLKVLEPGSISLQVRDIKSNQHFEKQLLLSQALVLDENTDPLKALGIGVYQPDIPAVVGEVVPGLAADKAGLLTGDKILAIDGEAIESWQQWVDMIQQNIGNTLQLEVLRNEQIVQLDLIPEEKTVNGKTFGFVGVGAAAFEWPEHLVKQINYNPLQALHYAYQKTWDNSVLILVSTWKLAVGDLARDNLGGPIMIAKMAGRYASYGFEPYLLFIAYISIVLGVMNLLPIPVLDGGHILFYSIELVVRKPIPEYIQMFAMRIGLSILLLIMSLAFFNDFYRIYTGSL
jgi:regulator of sigma E protease